MGNFFRRYLRFFLIFFFVLLTVAVGYSYRSNISYKNPDLVAESQARILAEKVGKLMLLPKDEIPTVARVSDPEALRDQAFFAEAKVGDVLLIYSEKAILYDPVANKIITVANVNLGNAKKLAPAPSGEGTVNSENENQF